MSCGNPVAEGKDAVMERKTKFERSTWCIKCKVHRGKLVVRHTVYCKDCFFLFVATKFRRCIGPHINESSRVPVKKHALKAAGNLLVGFSGGLGSTVLIDLLSRTYFPSMDDGETKSGKGGKSHPRNKSVWSKAYACYVEICNAFPEGEMNDRSEDIRQFFNQNKQFELVSVRLEDAFDPGWWGRMGGRTTQRAISTILSNEDLPYTVLPPEESRENPVFLLRKYLSSLPTQTAVQSNISILTRIILTYTAQHLRCSHLALGTSLTSLSVALISGVAQGSGFNIREEYFEELNNTANRSNADDQTNSLPLPLKVVRPLQDVSIKECTAWAYWKGLSVLGRVKRPAGVTGKQTIGSLTKSFIMGLERDYPSTVSTIVRTCSKVEAKDVAHDRCVLCERVTPSRVLDWKTRIAIRSLTECRSSSTPMSSDEANSLDQRQTVAGLLSPRLCYACHTHLTSRSPRAVAATDEPIYLPQWVNAHLLQPNSEDNAGAEVWLSSAMHQREMKSAIGNFLLQD